MPIFKYNNFFEHLLYHKLYRAPRWLWRKVILGNNPKAQVVKMRLGHKMNIVPSQQYLKSVIWARQYHDENIFVLRKFITKKAVILDIGANIGLYSCAYAQYFKDIDLKVYSIEAFTPNFLQLKKNVELNHFDKINIFNIALGNKVGELEMFAPDENFVGNMAGANVLSQSDKNEATQKNHKKFTTKMITLDQWAREQNLDRCDFIKIDIEGAEYFTFIGGREFIAKTRPVIQTEFNMYWLNNIGVKAQDFLDFFSKLDYVIALEEENSYRLISDAELVEKTLDKMAIFDILFIPKEKNKG